MKPSFKYWIFLGAIYFAIVSIIVASLIGSWASLNEAQQTTLSAMLSTLTPFPLLGTITIFFIIGALINLLFNDYIVPILKLAESARIISSVNPKHRAQIKNSSKEIQYLADIINQSADAFSELQKDVAGKIATAQMTLDEERTRLAALMSELPHGVIVCNTDGQVLLYNQQAQELFKRDATKASDPPPTRGLLGLGRSIFSILDRDPIVHGLEMLHKCHMSGRKNMVNNAMITLRTALCLRINMAPFFTEQEGVQTISGFVLTLEDMTRQIESDSRRDLLIQSLIDEQQKDVDAIRDAISSILDRPNLEHEELQSYRQRIDQASQSLQAHVNEAKINYAHHLRALNQNENVLAHNLLEIISTNINKQFAMKVTPIAPTGAWLQLDSYSMVQALSHLAGLLQMHYNVSELLMTLSCDAKSVSELVISWPGQEISSELLTTWQLTPLTTDTNGNSLNFQDTIANLSGEIIPIQAAEGLCTGLTIVLPSSDKDLTPAIHTEIEHRPISYEFDLFKRDEWQEFSQISLRKLTYVVFDTETTGLNPSKGDEIIQLGAIRIVNGQLLYHEVIDQLIDPQRFVPRESVAIHGIQPALLLGQPTLDKVLPHFQTFVENSVLVAHNAAFDMRFLQLQEMKTGIVFENPVLDTLLLSSIVHPNQDSHSLDDLAERLNVTIIGRHTALGDAIVTGEIMLKLIPLLEAQGIHTLADALAATSQSPFAKVSY
ncbi:DNA polymerase-3 subunit epsilon [Desulfuromusa kysingii]|uniref:DNA polymerase-3 subunit epsilon n=1 Tax=Desulfuromusa kysingii TaxID=37625 RepID=A0A1H4C4Y0_9BACT|nr:exonuclease domain-containing protein [Desulfuromusa kysingii]SEA55353.1 DNA polymerase-3 subunit epsilon [Desulfuromusa kysingii]